MLSGFVGLIAERGSISAFGNSTLPKVVIWRGALSAVQARNGLSPGEARTIGASAPAGTANEKTSGTAAMAATQPRRWSLTRPPSGAVAPGSPTVGLATGSA